MLKPAPMKIAERTGETQRIDGEAVQPNQKSPIVKSIPPSAYRDVFISSDFVVRWLRERSLP